ncbi:MAG: T9SS type A sorting domain-containing protein [Bacteroidales bacterium]
MKRYILLATLLILGCLQQVNSQVTVTGSTGANGSYTSLTNAAGAFLAINSTAQTGNTIEITITGNSLSETGVNSLGAGTWNTVTIYPTNTNLTISGNVSGPLLNLNGADHVTIDGRVNATGSAKDLTITNTNTGTIASTIRFINSAESNTVKYCTIKGSETSSSSSNRSGIIFFSTSTSGNGNDGNTIDNNDITSDAAGRATHAIFSLGASGFDNSENTISNNNIYNFLHGSYASCGIHLFSFTTAWTISGNSFYETTAGFAPDADAVYNAIQIDNSSGTGFILSGNYIGGRSSSCSGLALTKTNAKNNIFFAINLNVGTTPVTSIQNNTIRNIVWSNAGAAAWTGIQVTVGSANIGTSTGNTIGEETGTGSIIVTGGATGTNLYGINIAGSGLVNIQNNKIGSILAGNDGVFASNIYAINKSNTGTGSISNNTIGSTLTANSIQANSNSSSNKQIVIGINNTNGANLLTISDNTIANLTNSTTNSATSTSGMVIGIKSSSGINAITNNSIHDLTIANANTYTSDTASICGMALTGTNQLKTITGNLIYNLSNTNASFTGSVIGIYFGATGMYTTNSHTVTGNFIHSLSVSGSSSGASVYGIKINTGQTTYANNIISLGGNTSTTLFGFYETGTASNNNSLFFNTVYLGGAPATGNFNSYALFSAVATNTRNFRNNIFENARSNNGATGKHFAAFFDYADNTLLTLDFNDYYAPGTGGFLGHFNNLDLNTLPLITGLDAKSLNINPALANPGGTSAINYKPSSDKLEATTISAVPTDYLLINRAGTPTIGAFEGSLSLNIDVYKSGVYQSTYYRLKDAFDKINSGTHTGALELRIKANTTETASALLNASGIGSANYTSLMIYPIISGITISGNLEAPLVDLNSADNVTIDGRVNATGTARSLTITNSNLSSTSNTSTIRLINSAENNTIRYCTLKGGATGIYSGVVLFSGASAGNGNNGNLLDNCNFSGLNGSDRPYYILYSYGTSGRENSNNTISNNNVYDFMRPGATSYGIYIFSASTSWNVTGNSFYETASFVPTAGTSYYCIRINNATGNSFNISNNYIGGSNESCGGAAWTINSLLSVRFYGIHMDVGTTTPSSVQNNTIRNFNVTSSNDIPWMAIDANSGNINIGTSSGNIIGAPAGTGSIVLTNSNSINSATAYGIYVNSPGTIVASNNTIGSITTQGNASNIPYSFTGIYKLGNVAGSFTVNNNLIGSSSTAGSIQAITANTSSTAQSVYGIYSNGTGSNVITNNVIANLTDAHAYQYATNGQVGGICTSKGINTIQNNTIHDLSTTSPSNDLTNNAAIIGISQLSTSADQTVTGNTIYALNSAYTGSRSVNVTGLYYYGGTTGTNSISGNFIHSFTLAAVASGSAVMTGIKIYAGSSTISNNIINLGVGITPGYRIYGISENGNAGNNNNVWFNTVYIGGTVSGTTLPTYAFYNVTNNNTRDIRNNIFFNARSGGTSAYHYAIRLAGIANVTIDYNDYLVTGTNAMLGNIGTQDKNDLAAWKLGTGQDLNSLNINPGFTSPGGTSAINYYTSTTLPGITGTGVTTDFAGLIRSITPKMGAFERNSYTWKGSLSNNFADAGNWLENEVPVGGANIIFDAAPVHHCVLDGDRIVGDITNASAYNLVVGAHQLTINKSLTFTGSGKIDATAASAVIVFAGSSAQSLPSGVFASNMVDALNLDNSNGLTLNGTLTIAQTLSLTNGAFTIGANTLNLNGGITTTAGSLTGGGSSNINFGGSGAGTTLPAVMLNDLTINRANGIVLGGSVGVAGTLTLTNGTLTVGANGLTISGNSPVRTNGYIDASNVSATLTFTNNASITLPASVFSAAVNNLTIEGASGIIATSDLTVNGVLNLASANQSATQGCLDMWDGAAMKTLTMGGNATTTGTGDVTGIVTRNSFIVNTPYSFGNQFTTFNMAAGGVLPASLSCKITLTSSNLSWKPNAIWRYYDFIQTGGNNATIVTVNLHYLDTELNGATEGNLDLFDYHKSSSTPHVDDHGRSNDNTTDNWVGLANLSLTYVARSSSFDSKYWTLGTSSGANYTWIGATTDWNSSFNWLGGVVPGPGNHVVVPDASTTPNDPELPANTTIGSILIQAGGVLNGGTGTTLTVDGNAGAWDNMGFFNAGTSTVIFVNDSATMSDPTNFYNVTVADGAKLTLGTGNTMRIAGTLSLSASGILNAASNHNTVEYNGTNQTVINPNGSTGGYHNLVLGGSGTKTLPGSALSVAGDFILSETTEVSAAAPLTIGGNLTIGNGTSFNAGTFGHAMGGNFDNQGTFLTSQGGTLTLNGNSNQLISGTSSITFDNLTVNNPDGANLYSTVFVASALTLSSGNLNLGETTLGISGPVYKTSGQISVTPLSSLSFYGSSAITLPSNLFSSEPVLNNLTINRAGGVTLGDQNLTINGLLTLTSGTFSLGSNTLTIKGISPVRSSGFINAGNNSATLVFDNASAITLPASIFATPITNLTITGTGGITASSDFTINGTLLLHGDNPSATKGSLDMWDGAAQKTLMMGANATTTGPGDVTGIVSRSSFIAGTPYTFGNQFTTITFQPGGTMPSQILAKISIGTSPSWKPTAINRQYDFIHTGGSDCYATIADHYRETELNGTDETELVQWTYGTPGPPSGSYEWGRSAMNAIDNWVAIANVNIGYFPTSFGTLENTLSKAELTSYTWNGSQSTSWTTIENWTPTGTPSSTSNVTIPDATTILNSPILSTLQEVKNLTIETAGNLTIAYNGKLTVNNTLINDAAIDGLSIKSTTTGTGSLIASNPVQGSVERYIPNTLKWHLLSSPVSDQPIWPEFAPAPSGNSFGMGPWNWDFYYWNPNASTTNQLYWVNLRKDNQGTYNNGAVDASGSNAGYSTSPPSFTKGRGYLVAYDANWNAATGSPETHLFSGTINAGEELYPITKGANAWNLAGNPYPSAIDWQATSGWSRSYLEPSGTGYDMWIYNDSRANYGVCNSAPGSSGTNLVSKDIAPMQAFFVLASASGSLGMTTSVQLHSDQTWLKAGTDADNLLRFNLTASDNAYSDEMIVSVNAQNDTGGSWKFWSMQPKAPELYTMKEGRYYSIDRRPSVDAGTIINIGVKAGTDASYTLDVSGVQNFFFAKSILLEDMKTGSFQELKNNPHYTFTANPSDNAERFHLHFGGPYGINESYAQPGFTITSFNHSLRVINNSGKFDDGNIFICDILGRIITQKRMTGPYTTISLQVPQGCYIVTVVTNKQTCSKKVFIH